MKRKVIENQGKNQVTTLQTLKYTTQQLTIKDAILEDQLDKEDKKEIEKIFKSRKIVKKRRFNLQSKQTCIWFPEIWNDPLLKTILLVKPL